MLSDLRHAARRLAKTPGFALTAVLTLAVGIGASTAIFSGLRAIVIDPLDFPRSDQLVQVWSGDRWPLSDADFFDLKAQSDAFAYFGVYSPGTVNVGQSDPEAAAAVFVTADALRAYLVPPLHGRLLDEPDLVESAAPVAVISYRLWQERFGRDPSLLNRSIRINGADTQVVGIMPRGFEFASSWTATADIDLWLPLALSPETANRNNHWLSAIARLKQDVSVAQANREIQGIGQRLAEQYPDANANKKFLVRPLSFEVARYISSQVWLLFAAVVLVLLVACANVASMLLARAAQRQAELGIRVALGASRRHVLRISLAESLALSIAGAALGLAIAYGGIELLKAIAPASDARKAATGLDAAVVLFALALTGLATGLTGLFPAFAHLRSSVASHLQTESRSASSSRQRHRVLRSLVIAQVAVAFVLANGAALFTASYYRILEENQKLATENVVTARLNLFGERYQDEQARNQMMQTLVDRLQALPGVAHVGVTTKLPLNGGSNTTGLVNDEVYDPTQPRMLIERSSIHGDYFEALGIKVLQGRDLQPGDGFDPESKTLNVVVNQTLAQRAWPDENPLGKVIRGNAPDPWFFATVVGVVEDVRQFGADIEAEPEAYSTPENHWGRAIHLVARGDGDAAALEPAIRQTVAGLDPELAVDNLRSMQAVVLNATRAQRLVASLISLFMAVALGLVAVGLYGTLSYHFQNRTRELGVRLAIGAARKDVLRLVYGQGVRWVGLGWIIGFVGICALSVLLRSQVYGMEGLTASPIVLSTLGIALATALACFLPARRAIKLDPYHALRAA